MVSGTDVGARSQLCILGLDTNELTLKCTVLPNQPVALGTKALKASVQLHVLVVKVNRNSARTVFARVRA
jgi:hypothetical protein